MNEFISLALERSRIAAEYGEVPVGAVIVDASSGEVVTAAHNLNESTFDPCAHAEILAIRSACAKRKSLRLPDCDLYVTLEPCTMCAAAISFARIRRLVFGAYDPKSGGVEHGAKFFSQPTCHHRPEIIGGIMETECAAILRDFFEGKRRRPHNS